MTNTATDIDAHVLIAGRWRPAASNGRFQSVNPMTGAVLARTYPCSTWVDCDATLDAAVDAAASMRRLPGESIARFLEVYADRMEACADELVNLAHEETALPLTPRLRDVELPRTTDQLRQAATAAREGSWRRPTIDTRANIRSYLAPIGPVVVFGPNNFPFAFNSIAGGDFAAAIAAGNPVIAKSHPSHPGTTQRLGQLAHEAVQASDLPNAAVQFLYHMAHEDGERLVSDPRVGATAFTGGRSAGLKLKQAADRAGRLIYLEMSSVNPVVILPGALRERGDAIAEEYKTSCLMGTGQFCTKPSLTIVVAGDEIETFMNKAAALFASAPVTPLLSEAVARHLTAGVADLERCGAQVLVGGNPIDESGYRFANTLMRATGATFLSNSQALQNIAFGNVSLIVVAEDIEQVVQIISSLEGNLAGAIYSHSDGDDDDDYVRIAPELRTRVGRLINDKMPTGVAVSAAMNHGGPFPATGHPGFTAVGIPASLQRFAMLQCFDNVRPHRLPTLLRDANPNGLAWRYIDGAWTQSNITAEADA